MTLIQDLPAYAGLNSVLSKNQPHEEDVENDLEGEKETIPDLVAKKDHAPSENPTIFLWRKTISGASKGVSEKTDSEYQRLVNQCVAFLIGNSLIEKREDFVSVTPPEEAPLFITAWIMNQCDDINLDGSTKPQGQVRDSYVHGQKMRASMTYLFGRTLGLGSRPWQRSEVSGKMMGNPSISERVSIYMMSLRTRKIHSGETPTSARAVTSEVLKKLYDENNRPENSEIKPYEPFSRSAPADLDDWAGGMTRRAIQAIYTIAFLCLLRSDEVLQIKREHVKLEGNKIILTLPFRKTHRDGGIKPFHLYVLPWDEAHLCPVRALAEWMKASDITSGYLFRKMDLHDRPTAVNEPMTSEQFLELFRNNLLDIGVDPIPYGTHSFRRGGCQYLSSNRRWSLRQLCDWGGWSTEFSNLTIVRYLLSWNDNPTEKREDYFNSSREPAMKCFQCGRSCHCA